MSEGGKFMIDIRPATRDDIEGIAKVHVESWRTTYEGIVDEDFLAGLSIEERAKRWMETIDKDPPLVACNRRGEVIGFAHGGKERSGNYPGYEGEIYAIYLLEKYQGKGIGKQLTRRLVERLVAEGFQSMLVIVLAENEAKYFYEALGGELIDEGTLTIGSKTHRELVYGWQDLRELTK